MVSDKHFHLDWSSQGVGVSSWTPSFNRPPVSEHRRQSSEFVMSHLESVDSLWKVAWIMMFTFLIVMWYLICCFIIMLCLSVLSVGHTGSAKLDGESLWASPRTLRRDKAYEHGWDCKYANYDIWLCTAPQKMILACQESAALGSSGWDETQQDMDNENNISKI